MKEDILVGREGDIGEKVDKWAVFDIEILGCISGKEGGIVVDNLVLNYS
jgi:hypothetical protein